MAALEGVDKYKNNVLEWRHRAGNSRLVLLLLAWRGQLSMNTAAGVPAIRFEYC